MPAQLSAQREEESVGNHETETLHKAPRRLTLAQRICNILGDDCGLARETVLLSTIAVWAQESDDIRQQYGVFLPPHPWADLEGIPSL